MATPSLLLLLDDIASILDDVSVMAKVATKKTAGVLGDDLALNAEQVSNVPPARELAVVWAVAKGSFVNKAILVPSALLISTLVPVLVIPLLMIGGAFLCFEGVEKVVHKFSHDKEADHKKHAAAVVDPNVDLVQVEKAKIRGAIRTDFILSAEIMVIALGTTGQAPFAQKALLLTFIGVVFTVFVYGLVAGIVKLDDFGLAMLKKSSSGARALGRSILWMAPWMLKGLSLAGTIAMFLVGGGIIVHGIKQLDALSHHVSGAAGPLGGLVSTLFGAVVGIVTGALIVMVVKLVTAVVRRRGARSEPSAH